jgi:hypothetical protein
MSLLLRIFRPRIRATWQQFCEEIGADFVPGKGLRGADTIRAYHENWTITIDTYKRGKRPTVTRIRAPYVNADSFYFRIFNKGAFSGARKLSGMQDVVIGFPRFDQEYIIQGNDEIKLRQMFTPERIRRVITWQPAVDLWNREDKSWMTNEWREGRNELSFQTQGVIADIDQLRDLYDLFAEILNHLCQIGSAYEDDPSLPK